MARLSPAAFRDLLGDLDDGDLAAFVAAVYDARGWETELSDDGVVAAPPDGRQRRFAVPPDADAADTAGAGRVIAAEPRRDVAGGEGAVVDDADLRRMITYAVDADATERLCRRFFGRDPDDIPAPVDAGTPAETEAVDGESDDGQPTRTGSAGETAPAPGPEAGVPRREPRSGRQDATDGDADGSASTRSRMLVVGLAVALVGVLVIAAGPALTSSGDAVGDGVVGNATTETAGGAAGSGSTDDGATADENGADNDSDPLPVALEQMRAPAVEGPFPPGVGEAGIDDPSRLADAHEASLSGRSFRMRIAHREFVDGTLRGVAHERVTVAGPDRYRSDVYRLGRLDHDSTAVATRSSYRNGTTRFVRVNGSAADADAESLRIEATEPDRFADRSERYVRWYLSVDGSRITGSEERDGTTLLRITLDGDPWPGTSNLTGWALVDRQGTVRMVHREYTPTRDPSVRIETTVRIDPDEATVTRPEWVDAERNATAVVDYGELPPSLEGRPVGTGPVDRGVA